MATTEYTPITIQHQESCANLPTGVTNPSPLATFELFFTTEILTVLVENTNIYASKQLRELSEKNIQWHPTNIQEMRVFIGVQIYMGLHPETQLTWYWRSNPEDPIHQQVKNVIGKDRFKQLDRFFHISNPEERSSGPGEYHKVNSYFYIYLI
jgi:hypothetical protein